VLKIWQPEAAQWIARQIRRSFGADLPAHNALWLDISSCELYSHADAYSQPVLDWDDELGQEMSQTRWGARQRTKLAELRAEFPGVQMFGNNFRIRMKTELDQCNGELLGAYDGAVLEHWLKGEPSLTADWLAEMDQHLTIQAQNLPALYWVRTDRNLSSNKAMHMRFAYGSFLLGHRATATRSQYGGQWGLERPEQFHFYAWGAPLTTPASLADLAVADSGLYRRDFENGIVVVNPQTTEQTYQLDGTYYDMVNRAEDGSPRPVTSITLASGDAAFLSR
jgi:hypothetical protein